MFKGHSGSLDEVSEEKWIECVTDDWNRLSGDYPGQLQRWLSVFPREQVYLGFFEEIVHSPRRLLREMLEFLEIDPSFADSENVSTRTRERRNSQRPFPPSPRARLVAIHGDRTRSLAEHLHDEHGMTVPLEWAETLAPPASSVSSENEPAWVGSWDAGDDEWAPCAATTCSSGTFWVITLSAPRHRLCRLPRCRLELSIRSSSARNGGCNNWLPAPAWSRPIPTI